MYVNAIYSQFLMPIFAFLSRRVFALTFLCYIKMIILNIALFRALHLGHFSLRRLEAAMARNLASCRHDAVTLTQPWAGLRLARLTRGFLRRSRAAGASHFIYAQSSFIFGAFAPISWRHSLISSPFIDSLARVSRYYSASSTMYWSGRAATYIVYYSHKMQLLIRCSAADGHADYQHLVARLRAHFTT